MCSILARHLRPLSCQTWGVSDRRARLAKAHLYLVCGEKTAEFVHASLRGGVDIIQLRIKGATDDAVLAAALNFKRVCDQHGTLLIINDHPELAVAAGADGVHLGQDDMPVAQARRLVGEELLIGLSTHTETQIDAAGRAAVDYIGVGPVIETPTKPGRPAVGLELVRYAAEHAPVPFFAIGGISTSNVVAVGAAGARRVAVVRAMTEAADPQTVAAVLRSAVTSRAKVGVGST